MTHASSFPQGVPAPASTSVDEGPWIRLAESGRLPDAILRAGMRRLCRQRLREEYADDPARSDELQRARIAEWRLGPVALATEAANVQHYEVPAEFFRLVLGPCSKYSCALWDGADTLEQAEQAMLELTCARAGLGDGMSILDLGCGWGAFTLFAAARLPHARLLAVSNSTSQREWILREAERRRLANVEVVTADVNRFEPDRRFDRVVSVEMLEHVRNHEEMFRRIRRWLNDGGAFFAHVFCHRQLVYPFESNGRSDWMARHFFSGGMMPSYDLFLHYPRDLILLQRWWLPGTHYARTSEAWLRNLDRHRAAIEQIFCAASDPLDAARRYRRWRLFFMAVAELFGFDRGRQWGVGHYLFAPR